MAYEKLPSYKNHVHYTMKNMKIKRMNLSNRMTPDGLSYKKTVGFPFLKFLPHVIYFFCILFCMRFLLHEISSA